MSLSSRVWKENLKENNRTSQKNESSPDLTCRKNMTLKAYRRWRRYCGTYDEREIKRHIACLSGREDMRMAK